MDMTRIALALFTLLLLPAPAAEAASLVGSWNCQAAEGRMAIGRHVTYTADGRMLSRMTFRFRMKLRGITGSAQVSSSADGRYAVKDRILAERIDVTRDPAISFTANGETTRMGGREAEDLRRDLGRQQNVYYVIRRLTERRLALQYVSRRQGNRSTELRFSCRRIADG